jgi:uncharacterized membrane protein
MATRAPSFVLSPAFITVGLPMKFIKIVLKIVVAVFLMLTGVQHFRDETFFLKIMPDYIPASLHLPAVHVSGVAEILLSVMLVIPKTTRLAGWGIIALLIAVFPANIYAYQHSREVFPKLDPALHFWRLPLQGVGIALAWWFTRTDRAAATQPSEPAR